MMNELKNVFEAFIESFDDEYARKSADLGLDTRLKDMRSDEVGLRVMYEFERMVECALDVADTFLYTHRQFLEHHFDNIFCQFEGSVCSHDKTRYILDCIEDHIKTGVEIEHDLTKKYTYQIPKKIFQNHGEIIEFYKGLKSLYFGKLDRYVRALADLMENLK